VYERRLRCAAAPDIVLLAAGMSRRFGSPKLAAEAGGRTLLERAVEQLAALGMHRLIVVVGPGFANDLPVLPSAGATVVRNAAPAEGLASSIRVGLREVGRQAEAVLLCLADQVALTTTDYRQLIEQWRVRPQQPAAAFYRSQPGVPAIFPRSWFDDLNALTGDRGAGVLLRSRAGEISGVPLPAAEFDVDTPADLERYRLAVGWIEANSAARRPC
jgi:molybdenum cofactor cytidylyltransferase